MKNFVEIFNYLKTIDWLDLFKTLSITIIPTYLSIFITIYTFKNGRKYQFIRERYEKLIFPLFSFIEPDLFSKKHADCTKIKKIIDASPALAGSRLNELFYYYQNYPTQKTYNKLCTYINREYDKCCFILGLKRRSTLYRLNRQQYKTIFMFVVFAIVNMLLTFIGFIIALSIIAIILTLIHSAITKM